MLISGLLLWRSYKKRKRLNKEKLFIEVLYREVNKENTVLYERLLNISKKLNEKGNKITESRCKRSSLTTEQREDYMNKILNFMNTEKPFLNSELTQKLLAEQLNIPSHHFSEVLNINLDKNFYNFINLYRGEEAKKIMFCDTENLTVLVVAFDSGFNSKASFNRVFKDSTGITSSAYKEQQDEKYSTNAN